MPKRILEEDLAAILSAVQRYDNGASLGDITEVMEPKPAPRTLQYRLKHMVSEGRLIKEGDAYPGLV